MGDRIETILKATTALATTPVAYPVAFDGGSGSDGGGEGGGDGDSSAETPSQTALGGDAPDDGDKGKEGGDETADKDSKGDKPADEGKESEKGKEKTDQDSGPLALQAPEGFEDYQADFDKFAADMDPWLKANPDAAPKDILAEAARRQAALVAQQSQDNAEAFNAQLKTWENEAKADKEIGGDNYEQNVATAVKAVEAFGDQDLKDVLNQSGLGNHPAVIRAFVKAGAQLKEAPVLKGAGASENMTLADALYDKEKT